MNFQHPVSKQVLKNKNLVLPAGGTSNFNPECGYMFIQFYFNKRASEEKDLPVLPLSGRQVHFLTENFSFSMDDAHSCLLRFLRVAWERVVQNFQRQSRQTQAEPGTSAETIFRDYKHICEEFEDLAQLIESGPQNWPFALHALQAYFE